MSLQKRFEVAVEVTIRKWYVIEAASEEEAQEKALEGGISTESEAGVPEKYDEQVVGVRMLP